MHEPNIIVLRGLPGSGKTRWAHGFLLRNRDAIRVNRNDLRSMLYRQRMDLGRREEYVSFVEQSIVRDALAKGLTPVVDSMNLNNRYARAWYDIGSVRWLDFHAPLEELLQRNLDRPFEDRIEPDVLRDQWYKYTMEDDLLTDPPRDHGAEPRYLELT